MSTTVIFTLSLHDALPIFTREGRIARHAQERGEQPLLDAERGELAKLVEQSAALGHQLADERERVVRLLAHEGAEDRKSTRLNSSHLVISYAVFCLKKKNT